MPTTRITIDVEGSKHLVQKKERGKSTIVETVDYGSEEAAQDAILNLVRTLAGLPPKELQKKGKYVKEEQCRESKG